jgi:3-hydroxyisobutyrate dehydrogenase-like beta-hydroxyacid dehydrogenase
MMTLFQRKSGWLFTILIICLDTLLNSVTAQSAAEDRPDVTVLGLGSMGQAFVQCLVKDGTTVHAWNRGLEKREAVRDIANIYETAELAVKASNITLILIDDWEGMTKLVQDIDRSVWEGKVVVLFSTYTPTDILKLQKEFFTGSTNILVGGAIVGVPQTICSPMALVLLSQDIPALRTIGRIETFAGNVGYAALVNMALILVITFGIAGQELAHLILQQYGVSEEFVQLYIPLSAEFGPNYTKMLLPMASKAISSKNYDNSYVPVGVFRHVLEMHASFMNDLGIKDDTFLSSYLNYLRKVTNTKLGPAAWVEEAVLDVDAGGKEKEEL